MDNNRNNENYYNSVGFTEIDVKNAFQIIKRVLDHRGNVINHFYGGDSDTWNEAHDNVMNRLGLNHKLSTEEIELLEKREYEQLCLIDKNYQKFYNTFVQEMNMALGIEEVPKKEVYDDLPF